MSPTELTKVRDVLARALSVEAVNQLGRDTGQAVRLRTVTPHRLFLAVVSALASGHVASLADLLRAFNYHNGVHVAYKAFYNRLARVGFTLFMRGMWCPADRAAAPADPHPCGPHGGGALHRHRDPRRVVVCGETDPARDVSGAVHDARPRRRGGPRHL